MVNRRIGRHTQLPMNIIEPESDWVLPDMGNMPDLSKASIIGVDSETVDLGLAAKKGPGWATGQGHVLGWSFWTPEHGKYYLPVRHENGENLDYKNVKRFMQDLMKLDVPKTFHNAVYDLGWMDYEGIDCIYYREDIYDSMYAAALVDENQKSYSLDNVSKRWGINPKDKTLLDEAARAWGIHPKDIMNHLRRIPPKYVGPYAEQDAQATGECTQYADPLLRADKVWDLYQMECSLITLYVDMRRKGVRVDLDRADQLRTLFDSKRAEYMAEINARYGHCESPWVESQVGKLLNAEGIETFKTPTGHHQIQAVWLEKLDHPLGKLILGARRYYTAGETFVDSMVIGNAVNGRLHAEYHPLRSDDGGTVSGRFSCSNPNMQQVPIRDPELGPLVRSMYLPEEDCLWGSHDYSQQEPRLTVHYAELLGLQGGREAGDYYREDENADYHKIIAAMAGIERSPAKTLNLGLAYGMGGVKLCEGLGLPTRFQTWTDKKTGEQREKEVPGEEGEALFERYHERVPYVRGLTKTCGSRASKRGYIKTILGRRCRFDKWEPSDFRKGCFPEEEALARELAAEKGSPWFGAVLRRAFTHKALNRLIQGSAADQMKKAMSLMWKEGINIMVQVHDEVGVSLVDEKMALRINEIMIHAVELEVPTKVDCEIGINWGDALHKLDKKDIPWSSGGKANRTGATHAPG